MGEGRGGLWGRGGMQGLWGRGKEGCGGGKGCRGGFWGEEGCRVVGLSKKEKRDTQGPQCGDRRG